MLFIYWYGTPQIFFLVDSPQRPLDPPSAYSGKKNGKKLKKKKKKRTNPYPLPSHLLVNYPLKK